MDQNVEVTSVKKILKNIYVAEAFQIDETSDKIL